MCGRAEPTCRELPPGFPIVLVVMNKRRHPSVASLGAQSRSPAHCAARHRLSNLNESKGKSCDMTLTRTGHSRGA